MNRSFLGFSILATLLSVIGCSTADEGSAWEHQSMLVMRDEVLSRIVKGDPVLSSEINNASGYATFRYSGNDVLYESYGYGRGVVKNNLTGKLTFMKMGRVGADLQYEIKNFDLLFVFKTIACMKAFINDGQAEDEAIVIYEMTESGWALPLSVEKAKYWKNDSLN